MADPRTTSSAQTTRSPWFYHGMALTTVLIWSFSFLHIVWLGDYIDPVSVVVLRKDIFAIMLAGMLLLWRRPNLRGLTVRQWMLITAMALVAGPAYHFTFAWSAGEGRIDVALLGLILATVPVHAGWLGWVFLGERLTPVRLLALALGLGGVMVVIFGRNGRLDLAPTDLAGPIAATGAAMLAAGGTVLTRASRTVLGPIDLFLFAGCVVVIVAALAHPIADFHRIGSMSFAGWWAAFYLGIFGSGIAFLTWVTALSGLRALTVAMYLFLASVLSAFWGWTFRGEQIGWPFVGGSLLVLTGLILPTLRLRQTRLASSPATTCAPAPATALRDADQA